MPHGLRKGNVCITVEMFVMISRGGFDAFDMAGSIVERREYQSRTKLTFIYQISGLLVVAV